VSIAKHIMCHKHSLKAFLKHPLILFQHSQSYLEDIYALIFYQSLVYKGMQHSVTYIKMKLPWQFLLLIPKFQISLKFIRWCWRWNIQLYVQIRVPNYASTHGIYEKKSLSGYNVW